MNRKKNLIPLLIFLIGLCMRLIYIFQMSRNDPLFYHPFSDSLQYHHLAISILRNGIIGSEPFYHPPLFQYYLALIYNIFGINLFCARIIQIVLGSINILLIYLVTRQYFDRTVAMVASFIAAVYPMFIFYDGEILIPTVLIFLVLLGIFFLGRKGLRDIFFSGILFGLAAITRQNVLLIILLIPLFLLINQKKVILKKLLFFWLGSFLMIFPVTLRNVAVLKEPILISWQGGVNFYIGNNPHSNGITGIPPGSKKVDWFHAYLNLKEKFEHKIGHPLSNSEFDRICYAQGLNFVMKYPLKAFGLFIKKFYLFFAGFEISSERDIYRTAKYSYLGYILFHIPFLQFPFGVLCPLFIVGIYLLRDHWRKVSNLLLFILFYSLSFVAFFVNARYRMAIIPLIIIIASYTIVIFLKKMERKKRGVSLIIFVSSFIILNANLYQIRDPDPYLTCYELAQAYNAQGRLEDALRQVDSSIMDRPDFAEAHNLRGVILKKMGYVSKAQIEFQKAIELDSTLPDPYINLGNISILTDQNLAESYYQKAIMVDSNSAVAFNNLGNIYLQKKSFDRALKYYNRALNIDPEYVSPLYHIGLIYYELGNRVRAESLWFRVLRIDPQHRDTQRAIKYLLRKKNL